MAIRRYTTILFSAAALFAAASFPGAGVATELPVSTRVVEKPRAEPSARPAVRVARRPTGFLRRSYQPLRYASRPPIRYAALEQRRWTHTLFLGVGF